MICSTFSCFRPNVLYGPSAARAYCIKELLRVMPEVMVEKDRAGEVALHGFPVPVFGGCVARALHICQLHQAGQTAIHCAAAEGDLG